MSVLTVEQIERVGMSGEQDGFISMGSRSESCHPEQSSRSRGREMGEEAAAALCEKDKLSGRTTHRRAFAGSQDHFLFASGCACHPAWDHCHTQSLVIK